MSGGAPVSRAVWHAVAAPPLAARRAVAGRPLDTMTQRTRAEGRGALRAGLAGREAE